MVFELEIVIRILAAGVLGGIIGFERESRQRPAGFRTHILVSTGAALVMIVSEYMFMNFPSANVDLSRLGAQVISGIGFLGAGTIIRDKFNVKGLTTAASLWAVACIGLAVGMGYFYIASITSLIIFVTLRFLGMLEKKTNKKQVKARIKVYAILEKNIEKKIVDDIIAFGYDIEKMDFNKSISSNSVVFTFRVSNNMSVEWEDVSISLFKKKYITKVTLDY